MPPFHLLLRLNENPVPCHGIRRTTPYTSPESAPEASPALRTRRFARERWSHFADPVDLRAWQPAPFSLPKSGTVPQFLLAQLGPCYGSSWWHVLSRRQSFSASAKPLSPFMYIYIVIYIYVCIYIIIYIIICVWTGNKIQRHMRNPKAETFSWNSWNPWNLNQTHPTPRTAWHPGLKATGLWWLKYD